jgi:signal peptidase I
MVVTPPRPTEGATGEAEISTSAPHRAPRRVSRWLAYLVALLLPPLIVRGCVLDAFSIEQRSMEPAFQAGDHLLVLQQGVDSRPLARWDVLVLEGTVDRELPPDVGAMLKRAVGLPGEYLHLEDGDVYVAEPGAAGCETAPPALVRKPDDLVAGLLVPVHGSAGLIAPWTWAGPGLREDLPNGGTRLAVEAAFGQAGSAVFEQTVLDGLAGAPGEEAVHDTALQVRVGAGDAALELWLREGADVFHARLAPAARGGALLHHNLGGGVVASEPDFPGLRPGEVALFWNVDNRVRLRVGGLTVLAFDYARNEPQLPGAPLRNEPALAVEGGDLVLLEVTVLRDLHYSDRGVYAGSASSPSHVPEGQMFVLGDHSSQSRDSRYFGPVPLERVLGRPLARYAPAARSCWLSASGLP